MELKSLSENIKTLNAEVMSLSNELAMSEVIDFNRIDLQRFEQREQEKIKRDKSLLERIKKEQNEVQRNTSKKKEQSKDDR